MSTTDADARVSSAPQKEQKSPVARATAEYFRDADRSAGRPHILEAGSAESQERERYLEQRCQELEAALREYADPKNWTDGNIFMAHSSVYGIGQHIAELALGVAK